MSIFKKMSLKNLTIGSIFFGACLSFCEVVTANPVTITIKTPPGVKAIYSEEFWPTQWTISGKLTPMEELRYCTKLIEPNSSGQIQIYQKLFDEPGYVGAKTNYNLDYNLVGSSKIKVYIYTQFNGKGELTQLSCEPAKHCWAPDKNTIEIIK